MQSHLVFVPVGEGSESEGRMNVCLRALAILYPAQRSENANEFRPEKSGPQNHLIRNKYLSKDCAHNVSIKLFTRIMEELL